MKIFFDRLVISLVKDRVGNVCLARTFRNIINNTPVMVSRVELVVVAVRAKIFTVGASDLNSCNSEYVSGNAAIISLFEVPLKSK